MSILYHVCLQICVHDPIYQQPYAPSQLLLVNSKFTKITRANQRNLKANEKLEEHDITFERLSNGDGCYKINIMVDDQRIHRVVDKESKGVTRLQAEELIATFRTDARHGRLNLPKGRKLQFSLQKQRKNICLN